MLGKDTVFPPLGMYPMVQSKCYQLSIVRSHRRARGRGFEEEIKAE